MADWRAAHDDEMGSLAWIRRAEDSIADNDFVSPIYLASAYEHGRGGLDQIEQVRKVLSLRERVAQSGNVRTMELLMFTYRDGLNGAPENHDRFVYSARRAAAEGSRVAAGALGASSAKKKRKPK